MPSPAVFGAIFGVAVQLYTNGVRKLPAMRTPWAHVVWAGVGATAFTYAAQKKEELEVEVQEMIAKRAAKSHGPPREQF